MKCIFCGCSDTEENPVIKGVDPYEAEINDNYTEVWECGKCSADRADEI